VPENANVTEKDGKNDDKPKHIRLAVYLPAGAYKQLEVLMGALHVTSRSALVAQSLARWYREEPLVQDYLQAARAAAQRGEGEP
jgi:hypothetical protein